MSNSFEVATPVAPEPVDLLVENAGHIYVTAGREIPGGWIAIRAGRIVALGATGDTPPPAAQRVNAGGRVVTPGMINTHHHIFQNLGRSYAPVVNAPLFTWSSTLSDMWANLTTDDIYTSTYVGIAEMLLGGCTTTTDNLYVHPQLRFMDAEIAAARDIGMRFFPTRGGMNKSRKDGFVPSDLVVQDLDTIMEDCERLIREYHDPNPGAMTRIGLSPVTPWTGDDALTQAMAAMSAEKNVRLHTHLSEDADEYDFCLETHGRTPMQYFADMGLANERTWVAHFAFPSDDEMVELAGYGTGVAHCPSSNMLICGDTAKVRHLRSLGVPVGLGTDGSASTDHASMWQEARTALLLGRLKGGPQGMSSREILDVATRGSAQCIDWDDEIGHLTPGALADLVVWDMPEVARAGAVSDPIEALLRCAPASAWTTIVNGRVLVDEGQLQLPELRTQLAAHDAASRRLQGVD